ncbi:MAG TPA: thiazole synthase [Gemmatimonadota bacterium]|jgi:thiazole synthase
MERSEAGSAGSASAEDRLRLGDREFTSRLILGTGKYPSNEIMKAALEASGTEIVTVAVRRVDLSRPDAPSLLDWIDPRRFMILPNTAGATTAAEAIRIARLGRAAGLSDCVKLEVIGDEKTLFPDTGELIEATRVLAREGFRVMPYTNDDLVVARKLEDAGAVCIMPLASPIGSGQGILNAQNILFIKEAVGVPVIVDAGVGTASDAAVTMELGVDGILMNTAVAQAGDPVRMARAMRLAVEAGRLAWESGRMPRRPHAVPSSPREGVLV